MSYIKEVQRLIDDGLNEEASVQLFQVLTNRFTFEMHRPETEDFRKGILECRKDQRKHFREIIDGECRKYPFPIQLNWRNVKFEPKRVKRCGICGGYFYDVSRNGNKITCFNNGICEHEHEIRRKRKGTLMEPAYKRRVDEIPIDFSPAEDDALGNAILTETEMTAWRNRETF
ncbi:hypothetical protein [Halobacillus campisalis]|uniref:Uncharacterized protein n=1 Tax=Halobacillus campisalis TaxID=435909 RepID=A0ABW2K557_9BACI|nr:hypothetical protein [Halobacillus campisalis]